MKNIFRLVVAFTSRQLPLVALLVGGSKKKLSIAEFEKCFDYLDDNSNKVILYVQIRCSITPLNL